MPFLDELERMITKANVAIPGVTLFFGSKPKLPAGDGPFLSIAETGGTAPEQTQNLGPPAYSQPSAQLVATGADYQATRALLVAALNVVSGQQNFFVGGTWYLWIDQLQEPFDGGLDSQDRATCKVNIMAFKAPS